jgi:hypothetical protein
MNQFPSSSPTSRHGTRNSVQRATYALLLVYTSRANLVRLPCVCSTCRGGYMPYLHRRSATLATMWRRH